MAITADAIAQIIQEGIPDADVQIEDLRGDGEHYAAQVISPSFQGLSRLQQHQRVHQALKGVLGGDLHALMLRTSAS